MGWKVLVDRAFSGSTAELGHRWTTGTGSDDDGWKSGEKKGGKTGET